MTWVDWAALALFFICWLGYAPILKFIGRHGGSLNDHINHIPPVWMASMTHREMKLIDSQLMGHSINSASFFASTNLLLIAAVGGILFGGESKLEGFAAVGADNVPTRILEAKLALVLICLARGCLDFIWALRQMNYTLALIGSAPEINKEIDRKAFGEAAAELLNPALSSFSQGVRGYYFALAAAAWLFGPLWLALGVASSFGLLIYRQEASPAARALRNARRPLG